MHPLKHPSQLGTFRAISWATGLLALCAVQAAPLRPPALPQTQLEVLPTRTLYRFAGAGLQLTLTFLTPALPDDIRVLSRPLTYLVYEVRAVDERRHQVVLYFEVAPELAVNDPGQSVLWGVENTEGLAILKVGSQEQPVLAKKGDDLRIDWGQLYLAVPKASPNTSAWLPTAAARKAFVNGQPLPLPPSATVLAASNAPSAVAVLDAGHVATTPVSRWFMLAYDDEYSINYFRSRLRPFWRGNGDLATGWLEKAAAEYGSLKRRCERFDIRLMDELRRLGGLPYAQLCSLAYRQTLAGNKIVADPNGQPLMFPKENFSNGCIGTVDVLFPQAPFFLVFSPALTKAMLVPVLNYAASDRWPYPYAPHDLGTYPHATGQVYGMSGSDGDRMPVEESGNMLITLAALAKVEGHANLALKAIIAIGGYAQLCELTGRPTEAKKYLAIARDYAAKWQELARDKGRTVLAYGQPGTWAMKHNLIWDRVLGLNLIPPVMGDAEIAWYLKVQNRYGLPVDNRTDTSLIDWALWSIAPARKDADFQALLGPIWRYVHETPSRVPLPDWFVTTDAKQKGFQARPVVGGVFIKMLADEPAWRRWAKRGANTQGPWAPFPALATLKPGRVRELRRLGGRLGDQDRRLLACRRAHGPVH